MATYYVDIENGNDANDGLSFANRKQSLATVVNAAGAGDTIRVKESADPVSIGACTWTNNGGITIPSGKIKDVYSDGAWTAAANVTSAAGTTLRKQGANSASLTIAAGFTTGKIAHYPLGSTENFSSYQKLSLWFYTTVAIADASIYYIALCSDTTGNVVVDTLTLPARRIGNAIYTPLLLNKGSALGSSIQSVALYATSDPGIPVITLDNIFATNDINLRSVISKDPDVEERFYSIKSIVGTDVILDMGVNSTMTTTSRGYFGVTESIDTFILDGIEVPSAAANATVLYTINTSGTSGSPKVISGGWNRTDMSTQTGRTWLDHQTHTGVSFSFASTTYIEVEKFGFLRPNSVFTTTSTYLTMRDIHVCGCYAALATITSVRIATMLDTWVVTNGGGILTHSAILGMLKDYEAYCCQDNVIVSTSASQFLVDSCKFINSAAEGIQFNTNAGSTVTSLSAINCTVGVSLTNCSNTIFKDAHLRDNTTYGITFSNSVSNFFNGLTTDNNTTAAVNSVGGNNVENYFLNWVKDEAIPVNSMADYDDAKYLSINNETNANEHIIYTDGGRISSEGTIRYEATGIAWKLQPMSSVRSSVYPLSQNIRGVPVKGGVSHTASVWMRRDSTNIEGNFVLRGTEVPGVSSKISSSITVGVDTWEEVSLTFTPTIDAVIDFQVEAYGGTTHTLYWDKFTVTAASKNEVRYGDYAYRRAGVYATNVEVTSGGGGGSGETINLFC